MPWYTFRFEDETLPDYGVQSFGGTRLARQSVVRLADGSQHDLLGTAQADQSLTPITHSGLFVAASNSALETAYEAMMALTATPSWLYRQWSDSGDKERIWARLLQQPYTYTSISSPTGWSRPWRGEFLPLSPVWNGERFGTYELGAGMVAGPSNGDVTSSSAKAVTLSSGTSTNLTLPNTGNAEVKGVYIVLSATTWGGDMTFERTYTDGKQSFTIDSGSLTNGTDVIIDCASKTVTHGSALGAYGTVPTPFFSAFSRDADHNSPYWFTIPVGANTNLMSITASSTSTFTTTVHYAEAWQ